MRNLCYCHVASALLLFASATSGFVVSRSSKRLQRNSCCWEQKTRTERHGHGRGRSSSTLSSGAHGNDDDDDGVVVLLDDIKGLRVRELKEELTRRRVSIVDVFEKEELVRRLYEARVRAAERGSDDDDGPSRASAAAGLNVVTTPITFFALDGSRSVPAASREDDAGGGGGVFLRPSPGRLPALSLEVVGGGGSGDGRSNSVITLLLDTACSGIVLRPNVVRDLGLAVQSTPMTMTAAGGTATGGGVARLDSLRLVGSSAATAGVVRGPFPVAVQDIGALPIGLDGILGTSFLNRYDAVDVDFGRGRLSLTNDDDRANVADVDVDDNDRTVVAETDMVRSRLGVYAVDVTLDGRGPVKMLLDTGAASTLLSWKGVSQMGLSASDDLVRRNPGSVGAMGADNVALELTHHYALRRRFNLARSAGGGGGASPGVSVRGDDVDGVKIDVGRIPVLDAMESEGVGGILGSDLLMKCDLMRLRGLKGPTPKVSLHQQ